MVIIISIYEKLKLYGFVYLNLARYTYTKVLLLASVLIFSFLPPVELDL